MNSNKKDELINESTYKYTFCRLCEGMKHIKHDPHKQHRLLLILALALLVAIFVQHAFDSNAIGDILKIAMYFLVAVIALIAVLCYILYYGIPKSLTASTTTFHA